MHKHEPKANLKLKVAAFNSTMTPKTSLAHLSRQILHPQPYPDAIAYHDSREQLRFSAVMLVLLFLVRVVCVCVCVCDREKSRHSGRGRHGNGNIDVCNKVDGRQLRVHVCLFDLLLYFRHFFLLFAEPLWLLEHRFPGELRVHVGRGVY